MTGFEPRTSGVGSDRSTNCATTTAHLIKLIWRNLKNYNFPLTTSIGKYKVITSF